MEYDGSKFDELYVNHLGPVIITAVIYGFRYELECLSRNTRLGQKGMPGTNTLAYYGNRKLQP